MESRHHLCILHCLYCHIYIYKFCFLYSHHVKLHARTGRSFIRVVDCVLRVVCDGT
jgi:hypothetical protein